jgi:hypothetical protein
MTSEKGSNTLVGVAGNCGHAPSYVLAPSAKSRNKGNERILRQENCSTTRKPFVERRLLLDGLKLLNQSIFLEVLR